MLLLTRQVYFPCNGSLAYKLAGSDFDAKDPCTRLVIQFAIRAIVEHPNPRAGNGSDRAIAGEIMEDY